MHIWTFTCKWLRLQRLYNNNNNVVCMHMCHLRTPVHVMPGLLHVIQTGITDSTCMFKEMNIPPISLCAHIWQLTVTFNLFFFAFLFSHCYWNHVAFRIVYRKIMNRNCLSVLSHRKRAPLTKAPLSGKQKANSTVSLYPRMRKRCSLIICHWKK